MTAAIELPPRLFHDCLSPTDGSTPARFLSALSEAAVGLHVETCNLLDLGEYRRLGHCRLTSLAVPAPVTVSSWGGLDRDEIVNETTHGAWRIECKDGEILHAVSSRWRDGYDNETRTWLLARSQEVARAFALDLARTTNDPGESILVFHGSCWNRNRELYTATQQASFDGLVLARDLKQRIRDDFRRFLDSRRAYEEAGLSWRRGALFLGPPGNGKTHTLRALVKELEIPSLYVQSVKSQYSTEEANLKRVFERARQLRPCALVLEDVDALVNDSNRSFFLNQLDGFEKNVGLIVLATTNHPERLDPAILDRPSRFDRKYTFALPELEERTAYLELWKRKLGARAAWTGSTLQRVAERTQGFSFAYLQELVISTLTTTVSAGGSFEDVLELECGALAEQIRLGGAIAGDQLAMPEEE